MKQQDRVTDLPIEDLNPNPFQSRTPDPDFIESLKESIERDGLLQPIRVRTHPEIPGGNTRSPMDIRE